MERKLTQNIMLEINNLDKLLIDLFVRYVGK